MKLLSGFDFGKEFLNAINEPCTNVRNIKLNIPIDGVVTAEIEKIIDADNGIVETIKKHIWIQEESESDN